METPSQHTSRLTNPFAIDARSLALFRIGLGALLVVDLVVRAMDLRWHYTDEGLLPRELMVKLADRPAGMWHWSLHLFNGTFAMQAFMFALAGAFAVLLMLGWRSRWMAFASWLLLTSLHLRNPAILNAGDTLLRMLTFWAMFVPLGGRFSIDAKRRNLPLPNQSMFSLATIAILLQFVMMYWCTGAAKMNPTWLEGDAMFRTLSRYAYARPIGASLLEYPKLLAVVSIATPFLEIILPLLCFSPWWTRGIRSIAIVVFVAFHVGIEMTMHTGLFPYVSMVGWLLFVPGSWWDRIGRPSVIERIDEEAPLTHPPAHPEPVEEITSPSILPRIPCNIAVALLLFFVIYWNVDTTYRMVYQAWHPDLQKQIATTIPKPLVTFGEIVNLQQRWGMFARPEGNMDGWFVFVGETQDGRRLNLLEGGEFDQQTYKRPEHPAGIYPNHRWRKFLNELAYDFDENARSPSSYREYLPRTIARMWNASHDEQDQIDYLELIFISSPVEEIGDTRTIRSTRFFRGIADPDPAPPAIIIRGQD